MAKARRSGGKAGSGNYAHYDADAVRAVARGQWLSILTALCGLSADIFNRRHQPCPRCGGSDRFRAFDNFAETGGVICNQCHPDKNGDGFSTVQWHLGVKFYEALRMVAEHLGVPPIENGKPGRGRPRNDGANADPAEHLEFQPWNDALVELLFCPEKRPITCQAIQAVGGRLARYRDRFTVIALPVWGEQLQSAPPVGWCLYNVSGGKTLPTGKKHADGSYDQVKVKLTWGSKPGIIGPIERIVQVCKPNFTNPQILYKTEGPSDLLALLSLPGAGDNPAFLAWTNSNGAGERPPAWIPKLFTGHSTYVIHDADRPGQDGATYKQQSDGQYRTGWCPALAQHAGETGVIKNIVLPYDVADTHGKDLRDWINEGGTLEQLAAMAEAAPVFSLAGSSSDSAAATMMATAAATTAGPASPSVATIIEYDDDPHRLARVFFHQVIDRRFLKHWRAEDWQWDEARGYRRVSEQMVRARINSCIKQEFDRLNLVAQEEFAASKGDREPPKAHRVQRSLVTNVIEAVRSTVILSDDVQPNTWLGEMSYARRPWIEMQNGILKLDRLMAGAELDEVLAPHSPNWFSQVCLNYPFDPEAKCPRWDAFLQRNLAGDVQQIAQLQEWAGYCLLPDTSRHTFMLLEGEGANGKSVYCAALEAMLGLENCSHVPLEIFSQRFALTQTLGKLANISAEVGEIDKVAEGHLKAFTSGDRMMFDRKNMPAVESEPTARLMLATNNRPRIADRSSGVWRRMLLVPFEVEIPKAERIAGMDKPGWWLESGELPGIFLWAIRGLHRLNQQGHFTVSEKSERAKEDYRHESNPTRSFLTEYCEESPGHWVASEELYFKYREWCGKNGYHPLADRSFGREVYRAFTKTERKQHRESTKRFWAYHNLRISGETF